MRLRPFAAAAIGAVTLLMAACGPTSSSNSGTSVAAKGSPATSSTAVSSRGPANVTPTSAPPASSSSVATSGTNNGTSVNVCAVVTPEQVAKVLGVQMGVSPDINATAAGVPPHTGVCVYMEAGGTAWSGTTIMYGSKDLWGGQISSMGQPGSTAHYISDFGYHKALASGGSIFLRVGSDRMIWVMSLNNQPDPSAYDKLVSLTRLAGALLNNQ